MGYDFDARILFPGISDTSEEATDEDSREHETTGKVGQSHIDTPRQLKSITNSFKKHFEGQAESKRGLFSYEKYARICFRLTHPELKALEPPKGSSIEIQREYAYFRQWTKEYLIVDKKLYKRGKELLLRVATLSNSVGLIVLGHQELSGAKARTTYSRLRVFHHGLDRHHVEWFMRRCPTCSRGLRTVVAPPSPLPFQIIKSSRPLERIQINLVDFTGVPSEGYNWVLYIKDHFSKMTHLYPLKFRHASEIAIHLDKFIRYFGAPEILQCESGNEFKGAVVLLLQNRKIKLINGRPRHPQSQGFVEKGISTVKRRLAAWMALTKRTDWPNALELVERSINTTCCKGLPSNMTPHECMFSFGRLMPHEAAPMGLPGQEAHPALAMTPEEVDRACDGDHEAYKHIVDFYDSMPSTDGACFGDNEDGDDVSAPSGGSVDEAGHIEIQAESLAPAIEDVSPTTNRILPVAPASENIAPLTDSVTPAAEQAPSQDIEMSLGGHSRQELRSLARETALGSEESLNTRNPLSQLPVSAEPASRAVQTISHASYITGMQQTYSQPHYQQYSAPQFLPHYQQYFAPHSLPHCQSYAQPSSWPCSQAFPPSFSPTNTPSVAYESNLPQSSPGLRVDEFRTYPSAHDLPPMSNPPPTSSSSQNPRPPYYYLPVLQMRASPPPPHIPPREATLDHSRSQSINAVVPHGQGDSQLPTNDVALQIQDIRVRLILEGRRKGEEAILRVQRHKQKEAASRVLKYSSSVHHKALDEGDIVTYRIPAKACGPLDMTRAYVKILELDSRIYPQFKLQTEWGVLADWIPRSELNIVDLVLSDPWETVLSNAPKDVISINTLGAKQSIGLQRGVKCTCRTGCSTNRCSCLKAGVSCTQYCGHRGCANRCTDSHSTQISMADYETN